MTLSAFKTVGEWLDDPVGGPIFAKLLDQAGTSADSLGPARGVPLDQLVSLSQGKFPQELVDGLVAAYRAELPEG